VTPKISAIRADDTHRLIPSRPSDRSVLERLTAHSGDVADLLDLEGATNDRLLGEANLLPGISVHELLYGVPYAHIVNAAFCHASPAGSRFNGPERGAWYAGFDLETSIAERTHHKIEELDEVGWNEPETFTFDDYMADFRGDFHDIRRDDAHKNCLNPKTHAASQKLAAELLAAGSAGIVYPSVRRPKGTCIACFRPALVTNVRKGRTVKIRCQPR
jgi:hypothetical protein